MINLDSIREITVYALSGMAECGSPDAPDSAGAQLLDRIRTAVLEAVEYADSERGVDSYTDMIGSLMSGDTATEIADGAPSVYTHERWLQFVDLAAYQEDASELGGDAGDLTACAGLALYMIAERLVQALLTEIEEAAIEADGLIEDDEDEDDDTED